MSEQCHQLDYRYDLDFNAFLMFFFGSGIQSGVPHWVWLSRLLWSVTVPQSFLGLHDPDPCEEDWSEIV